MGRDKEDNNFYKDRESKRSIMDIWSHKDLIKQDPLAMKKFNGKDLLVGMKRFLKLGIEFFRCKAFIGQTVLLYVKYQILIFA